MSETALALEGLERHYGDVAAVDGVDLTVRSGERFSLLGPSGSGKTTILRLIAGFEAPDAGSVSLAGQPVAHLPPEKRNIGVVFQDYALFPPPHGSPEHRLRPEDAKRRGDGTQGPCRGDVGPRRTEPRGRPATRSAFGRSTTTRGPGPRAGTLPPTAAAGRAVGQPRSSAAGVPPRGTGRHHHRGRHHQRARDPRPGRGVELRRPRRGPARRQAGTGRFPGGAVADPRRRVRRHLPRRHEPAARHLGRRRCGPRHWCQRDARGAVPGSIISRCR